MKCFGLTSSREAVLHSKENKQIPYEGLRSALTTNKPINDALFQRIKELTDREILRELKKRGSILESDLHEMQISGVKAERIKTILDYFSGEEYHLVEKKFAIVCKKSKEIIFLLNNKQDLDNAKNLVCPKCSTPIGEEQVLSYYEKTDPLKDLIDGSRWMPLLIRDELIANGLSSSDIYTEVKHGQDEIDLLAFCNGRVLIIEAKDRQVTLNDAYKLSAKVSRLENVLSKTRHSLDDEFDYLVSDRTRMVRSTRRSTLIPILISNYDIAQDARDLLNDTRESSRFLENATEELKEFINNLVEEFNNKDLDRRIKELTSVEAQDSISNLAANQVEFAFQRLLRNKK